MRHLEKNES